jgi:hypothetical protein
MQTKEDYTTRYIVTGKDYGEITVPKGTKLTHQTAMGIDKNYHFVDEFSWIKPYPDGTPKYGLIHDIKYRGLDVPKEYVEY